MIHMFYLFADRQNSLWYVWRWGAHVPRHEPRHAHHEGRCRAGAAHLSPRGKMPTRVEMLFFFFSREDTCMYYHVFGHWLVMCVSN